jgi:hypothetical protein
LRSRRIADRHRLQCSAPRLQFQQLGEHLVVGRLLLHRVGALQPRLQVADLAQDPRQPQSRGVLAGVGGRRLSQQRLDAEATANCAATGSASAATTRWANPASPRLVADSVSKTSR